MTSAIADQVLIYDLDDPSQDFSWDRSDYPYIVEPLAALDLLSGSKPTAIDAGYVQDPPNSGPFLNRAFVINSGKKPSGENYNSFAVINVNGSSSEVSQFDLLIGEDAEPVAVMVKSDGSQVYFACHALDQVRFATTSDPFSVAPVEDSTGQPAVIKRPIDIAVAAMPGDDDLSKYIQAIVRMVEMLPATAFAIPADRQLLITKLDDIINDTNQLKAMADVIIAREIARTKIILDFYRGVILEKMDRGLMLYFSRFVACTSPMTYLDALQAVAEKLSCDVFTPSGCCLADILAAIQTSKTQIGIWNYSGAIQTLTTMQSECIGSHAVDWRLQHALQEMIAATIACYSTYRSAFEQALAESQAMEGTVTSLPSSSFKNNGARQSLLQHIGQLIDRCRTYDKNQAIQRANEIHAELPSKVTNPTALAGLIAWDEAVLQNLNSIP